RPVWIETRQRALGDVWLDARLDGDAGIVEARVDGLAGARLILERDGERFAGELGASGGRCLVPRAARWGPPTHREPNRYHMTIEMRDGARVVALGHTGFRTVELGADMTVRVNDVPVFCRGACWTPLDARSLGATPAAYDAAIAQCARAGMNMLRVGGTM